MVEVKLLQLNFSNKFWLYLTVLLAAVVLLLTIYAGIAAGKSRAQAKVITNNAKALAQGFKYFYNDYSRFPTVLEYQNQELMKEYFAFYPFQEFLSDSCAQSYSYKRISASSFQLGFCLPKAVSGYEQGWNILR